MNYQDAGGSGGLELAGATIEENGVFTEQGAARVLAEYWAMIYSETPKIGPQWTRFDLMDVYKIANRMVVKDILNGGEEFKNRYWGTHVTDAFHLDATGKVTRDYMSTEATQQALDLLRLVIKEVRPVRVWGRAAFFQTSDHKLFEAAFVPLCDRDNKPTHVVSAFNFDYNPA